MIDEAELYSGLASQMWAAYDEPADDLAYFEHVVREQQGRALDVGCGTGRLLRRLRRLGYDIEGVDIAADQLAHCRRLADAEGLSVTLYQQPMQHVHLPFRYDAIIIPCGSLACVMDRRQALSALRHLRSHLRHGGVLVYNLFLDAETPSEKYPTPWQPWTTSTLPGGQLLVIDRRIMSVDPIEQTVTEQRRYRLVPADAWPPGPATPPILAEEVRTGGYRWYTRNEAMWMAELAGLTVEKVTGDYTDEAFGPQHTRTMVLHTR